MQHMYKAPGSERLNVNSFDVLSDFAFNVNLRHYNLAKKRGMRKPKYTVNDVGIDG